MLACPQGECVSPSLRLPRSRIWRLAPGDYAPLPELPGRKKV
jgi:hypothetical protein